MVDRTPTSSLGRSTSMAGGTQTTGHCTVRELDSTLETLANVVEASMHWMDDVL